MNNGENKPRFGEPVTPADERTRVDGDTEIATDEDKPLKLEEPDQKPEPEGQSRLQQWKQWYLNNRRISIPATALVVLILVIFAVPTTRYATAGLVIKKNITISVVDTKNKSAVSGATVTIGKISRTTNGSGDAVFSSVSPGKKTVTISKKYYENEVFKTTVPIFGNLKSGVKLLAVGRQVKVTVKNFITDQPIEGAKISFDNSNSVTNKDGETVAVVSADADKQQVIVSAKGFNNMAAEIAVGANEIKNTTVQLTPAGKVYFLSKLSGKIDVVKTDLDGSNRKTVLAGTGKEDDHNTILLATRDWDHLALLSSREGVNKVYIINTDSDGLVTMDQSDSDFTPVGWYDHYFVYTVARHGYNPWQSNAVSIKSYNADTGKILTLANSNASGSSNADAVYENFWDTQFVGEDVVYNRTWYKYPGNLVVEGKQNSLAAIHPDGSNSRSIKIIDAATNYITNLRLNKPRELQFSVFADDSSGTTTFIMDKNGNVNQTTDNNYYTKPALSYLESPASEQTFWAEDRDGKKTMFIGDQDAGSPKQIATLSSYTPFGWYSDKYLLVSKNSSELYIMPVGGVGADSDAKKITDYHKPALNFFGYGGGYGGL